MSLRGPDRAGEGVHKPGFAKDDAKLVHCHVSERMKLGASMAAQCRAGMLALSED
jgi:hypothetical protein